jgi:hypothetical protein
MISFCYFEKRKTGRDAETAETWAGRAAPSREAHGCDPRENPQTPRSPATEDSETSGGPPIPTSQTFFFPSLPEGLLPAGPSFWNDAFLTKYSVINGDA